MAADPQAKVFKAQHDLNIAMTALREAERDRENSAQEVNLRNQNVLQSMEEIRIAKQEAESAIKFDQEQRQLKQQDAQEKAKQQAASKSASAPSPVEQATQGLEQKINPGNPTAGVGAGNPAQLLSQTGPSGAGGGQFAQQVLQQLQAGGTATPGGPGGQPSSVQIAGQNFPVPGQIQTQRQTGQEGGSLSDAIAGVPRNTFETTTRPNVLEADQAAALLQRQQTSRGLLAQEERRTKAIVFNQITELFGGDPGSAAAVMEAWEQGGMGAVSEIMKQPGIKTTKQLELEIQRKIARSQIAKNLGSIPGQSAASFLGLAPNGHSEVTLETAIERHQAALKAGDLDQQTDTIANLYLQAGYVMLPRASSLVEFWQDDVEAAVIPFGPFWRMLATEEAADPDNRTDQEKRNLERILSLPVYDRDGEGYKINSGVSAGVRSMLENTVLKIHSGATPPGGLPESALPKVSRDPDDPEEQLQSVVDAVQAPPEPGRSLELGDFGRQMRDVPGKLKREFEAGFRRQQQQRRPSIDEIEQLLGPSGRR